MSSSFLFGIIFLGLFFTIESVYNPYLYDDGHGGEEHCCLVRVRDNFCMATPITRSLIQVDKQCKQFPKSKHRRLSRRNRNNAYIDKISRRLDVQNVHEDEEKIFIELQKPLEKNILENDLICLTSMDYNIDLEKCHVELADELYDDYVPNREHRERKHRSRNREENVVQMPRPIVESDNEEPEPNEAEKESRLMKISQPVRIREGQGLSFYKQYQVNRNYLQPQTRDQRRCFSWFREQMRKTGKKRSKSCVSLNFARENCIEQLISNTFNDTEPIGLSFPIGSKLFCKTPDDHSKLLGYYNEGELCFGQNDRIYLEYKFSDIARLSDPRQSKDALEFIGNNEKLTAEFNDDCHGQTNLVEETTPNN